MLADARFILLGRELDEEVAGVHGEEGGEEVAVGDVVGMDGVAVAAGAGVDADIGAFGGGEAGQDAVVEVGEGAEQRGAGPCTLVQIKNREESGTGETYEILPVRPPNYPPTLSHPACQ